MADQEVVTVTTIRCRTHLAYNPSEAPLGTPEEPACTTCFFIYVMLNNPFRNRTMIPVLEKVAEKIGLNASILGSAAGREELLKNILIENKQVTLEPQWDGKKPATGSYFHGPYRRH